MDTLQEWSKIWLFKLNVDKCKQLTLGKTSGSLYHIGDALDWKSLQKVVEERDLGVVFTRDMKWATQCQKAAAKAMSVLEMIKRSFATINKEMFQVL